MSESIRIRTTPNGADKYLKVNLNQDFDFIEILSLKISQEDVYRKFCSDYGVIVGRVSINNGFGVPNAKVSVFIPIDDVDKNDPLISGLYPYETVTDKDADGVRYNLLPKDGDMVNDCSTPVGTFPNKREVLDNETMLGIYCKYYKFTTTTNNAGDFMIFGVPLGQYTVHVDADVSDIGIASQRPYDLISQGTPAKMFYSPTKFNKDKNLDKLIQIKTMNVGVNVQPFWGDLENCEVGISRVDFDMNYTLRPSAIFMGSIFGDQDKHSISKRCRPRRQMGNLCEQQAGPGSIRMIRQTFDGNVEDFDVDGGRVIDDDGTWAYQVPMNLDYMVTDEFGNLALSNDPDRGIPTRARVRFNIGMDETGGEGRLRTRARYLVPNNPANQSQIDYSFGSETKNESFRDLYWNKIYSVTNFISRFQTNAVAIPSKTRAMTAIKDVDGCAGDKTPFPFNKVDTFLNPIFFIICLIIKIVAFLIYVMNKFVIATINEVLGFLNTILNAIYSVVSKIVNAINALIKNDINIGSSWSLGYIPCVHVNCPSDGGDNFFAPGCASGTQGLLKTYTNLGSPTSNFHYCGDPDGHACSFSDYAVGLDDCVAIRMAEALDMYKFDFYNDWINGSLFGFLLKYKKKKRGREIFCEYDCNQFTGVANYTGVDSNNNGTPDNSCHNNYLLDSCYMDGDDSQNKFYQTTLSDGLIKKVGDEFFYAATTHTCSYKLFATDVICLGSVFDCDWQAIPKVNDLLIPTSYKIPPLLPEIDATGTTEVTGMVDIGGNTEGLFFDVNCLGVHTNEKGCLNIRHICEIGVDIDQSQDGTSGVITANGNLGSQDIDEDNGKFFRDVFYGLNYRATPWIGPSSLTIPSAGFTTDFNTGNIDVYQFGNPSQNGSDYINFRGGSYNQGSYNQPQHSFFFYFGLTPGKTALDKMNQRFFTTCVPTFEDDLIIQTSTTNAVGATGTITLTFLGGTGPYTYTVTGPSGTFTGSANPTATITGLLLGDYTITGLDSFNVPISKLVTVSGPPPLTATVIKTSNATSTALSDGVITIVYLDGGVSPYSYELRKFDNTLVSSAGGLTPASTPYPINSLAVDTESYKILITDSSPTPLTYVMTTGLTISGPSPLVITTAATSSYVSCKLGDNGNLDIVITGGVPPYDSILTTGPAGFSSSALNLTALKAGSYITSVTDSAGTSESETFIVLEPATKPSITTNVLLPQQCDPDQYEIPINHLNVSGPSTIDVRYYSDVTELTYPLTVSYTNPFYVTIPKAQVDSFTEIWVREPSTTVPGDFCESTHIEIDKIDMELPPTTLAITNGTLVSSCTPLMANFNVRISHTVRAPYTIEYKIGAGAWTTYGTTFSPLTTLTDNLVSVSAPAGSNSISARVTDSKGCVSATLVIPTIEVPATVLSASKVTTGPSGGNYTHTVTASGGVAPYTSPAGTFAGTIMAVVDTSPTFSTTITDANGCTYSV